MSKPITAMRRVLWPMYIAIFAVLGDPVRIGAVGLKAGKPSHLFRKGEGTHCQLPLQKLQPAGG